MIHKHIMDDASIKRVRNRDKHSIRVPMNTGDTPETAVPPYNVGDVLYLPEQGVKVEGYNGDEMTLYRLDGFYDGSHFIADGKRFKFRGFTRSQDMNPAAARTFLRITHVSKYILEKYELGKIQGQEFIEDYALYSIDGKTYGRCYEWRRQPHVWVYDFELCERPPRFLTEVMNH